MAALSAGKPIEMLWALVKGYVARHYTGHRTITELVDQLYEGFDKYGTPAIVSKLVANTDCQATEWAKLDKFCDENGVPSAGSSAFS